MVTKLTKQVFLITCLSLIFLLLSGFSYKAISEQVSYDIYVVGEDRSSSGPKLITAGHNVTWEPDALQIKLADLSIYDQVWFVDIFALPDATGRANLVNFIKSGGKLFFVGDSYKESRAPLFAWRDSLFNDLGAGGITQSIDINPSQTAYYTNPFHVTSYSPNAVHYISHGEGRNGSFDSIGNGTVIVGAGLDATGDAVAIAFDYGTLVSAKNSRAVVYLNSNNTTNWDLYVANLAKFLGPKDKTVLSAKNTTALPGNVGHLKISLHNTKEISGVQFNLEDVPDLLSPIQFNTSYRTPNFSISYEEDPSGVLTVVISSEFGALIKQGTGVIADLTYTVDPAAQVGDSAEIIITDAIISDKFDLPLPASVFNGTFYCDVLKGDVVLDGILNIADLVRLINIILDRPPEATEYEIEAADYNSDGSINILDIVAIINVILGREPSGTLAKSADMIINGFREIKAEQYGKMIPVTLPGDNLLLGAQWKISYDPDVVSIGEPVLAPAAENMSFTCENNNGKLNILIFSLSGEKLASQDEAVFYLPTAIRTETTDNQFVRINEVILAGLNFDFTRITGSENYSLLPKALPENYTLSQNYPNPFNSETEIRYSIPEDSRVSLKIYNLLGKEVKSLVNQEQSAGHYRVHWNGSDANGNLLPSGVYFYRIETAQYSKTRKLTVLK